MSTYEFVLPDVGEGLGQGELLKWHVAVGEPVKTDQLLCDVQTDKAVVEIPSPVTGTLRAQGGQPGDMIDVGAMLAEFETSEGGAQPSDATTSISTAKDDAGAGRAPSPARSAGAPPVASSSSPTSVTGRRRAKASPAVRKKARAAGIDLATVAASGARGQVTPQDLQLAVEALAKGAGGNSSTGEQNHFADAAQSIAPPKERSKIGGPPLVARPRTFDDSGTDREEPLIGLRRQIAQTMQESWRNIPHIYTLREVDASALVEARRVMAADLAGTGIAMTFMPLFVKACVLALQANPRFNASVDMEAMTIIYRHRINIGIATATPDGLIVTVVHDADRKSIAEIAVEIAELARLGRERKANLQQLSGGTFTISNYGSQGAWMGTPIIRPPEVAIAGFGRIEDKVIAVDGEPAVRKILPLSIATDHRLNDGEHLGDFMASLVYFLGEPLRMLSRL